MSKYNGCLILPKTGNKFKEYNFLFTRENTEKMIFFFFFLVRKSIEKEKTVNVFIKVIC